MANEPWINRSPGDLAFEFPPVVSGDVSAAIVSATAAARGWARTPLPERIAALKAIQSRLADAKDRLAHGISAEVGKLIAEAIGEVGAVIAKVDLTIEDAQRHLTEESAPGPHPALVRKLSRGPAAVIAPFNFPLHLGHGATVAHLLAGNPVVLKPSPFASNVVADYGHIVSDSLPRGVFQVLQGAGPEGQALAEDPRTRSVCFTGSVKVGRALAQALAGDIGKDLALELGGSNAAIICADADLELAASAAAEAICLTAGQRCNSTSRIIVEKSVVARFEELLLNALQRYVPGDPLKAETTLGPLISAAAVARYEHLLDSLAGDWLLRGGVERTVDGKCGHYVRPAVIRASALGMTSECFVPIVSIYVADDLDHAVAIHNFTDFGLTASVFTRSEERFREVGDELQVGNLYANLPTTFSPSTLPFGGLRSSGNHHPGGRGFIRFTTDEQAVQWRDWEP
jgi:acyl-CoA reductase-like NAD-dependent aldehyde dehydrogenase